MKTIILISVPSNLYKSVSQLDSNFPHEKRVIKLYLSPWGEGDQNFFHAFILNWFVVAAFVLEQFILIYSESGPVIYC